MKVIIRLSVIVSALLLSACGPGSSGGSGSDAGTGSFTLRVTDAPIDKANRIVVEFIGAELRSEDLTAPLSFDFPPKAIDLLSLQGVTTATLVDDQPVPAGTYHEIRLKINAEEDGDLESFIELSDGSVHELIIPSGTQSGLKIKKNLVIPDGGAGVFTVDIDVRRSITVAGQVGSPRVKYLLKPVVRLVENQDTGSIAGAVHSDLLNAGTCSDEDPLTDNAVYVYAGADIVPDDIDNSDQTNVEPVTTTLVNDNGIYEAAFLEAGEYTVAFTCNAADENVDADDDLQFAGIRNATVVANTVTMADLEP